jgi:hypothetical protein
MGGQAYRPADRREPLRVKAWPLQIQVKTKRVIDARENGRRNDPELIAKPGDIDRSDLLGLRLRIGGDARGTGIEQEPGGQPRADT